MSSSLALAAPPMIVQSDLLGTLTCEPEDIVEFPTGLFGFPDCHGFLLLPVGDDSGLYWLQSVDSTALAFLLVDPFRYFDGYAVDLTTSHPLLQPLRGAEYGDLLELRMHHYYRIEMPGALPLAFSSAGDPLLLIGGAHGRLGDTQPMTSGNTLLGG